MRDEAGSGSAAPVFVGMAASEKASFSWPVVRRRTLELERRVCGRRGGRQCRFRLVADGASERHLEARTRSGDAGTADEGLEGRKLLVAARAPSGSRVLLAVR